MSLLGDVLRDRLAFAVRVGRDEDLARVLRALLRSAIVFSLPGIVTLRLEAVVDVDAELLLGRSLMWPTVARTR